MIDNDDDGQTSVCLCIVRVWERTCVCATVFFLSLRSLLNTFETHSFTCNET